MGVATLRAGIGMADLTPDLGRRTGGFSVCAPRGQGVLGRLRATALVVWDVDGVATALVSIDLHCGSRWVAETAASRLGWPADRLLLAGTHTHSGPSGIYGHAAYDRKTTVLGGFDVTAAERAVEAVVSAVQEAEAGARPARLGFGEARAKGTVWNRSPQTTMWNRVPGEPGFGQDPDTLGPPPPGRERAVAAWIEGEDPGPLRPLRARPRHQGGAEPAAMVPEGTGDQLDDFVEALSGPKDRTLPFVCGSTDLPIELERETERALAWSRTQVVWADGLDGRPIGGFALLPGTPAVFGFRFGLFGADCIGAARTRLRRELGVPVALGGGVLGDANLVSPDHSVDELQAARDDLERLLPIALAAGAGLAKAVREAVAEARTGLRDDLRVKVACGWSRMRSAVFHDHAGQERRLGSDARLGAETVRGGDLGPGLKGAPFGPTDFEPDDPHSPKRWWPFEKMKVPERGRVQVVRFCAEGDERALTSVAAFPAELTAGLARQMTDHLTAELGRVFLAGPAGDYLSYASTALEYRNQEYETSSVPWGRFSGDWFERQAAALARSGTIQEPPEFDLAPKAPSYERPGHTLPVPCPRFSSFAVDDDASGMEVARDGAALVVVGYWTPLAPEDRVTVTREGTFASVSDGTTTVDEAADDGLVVRIGGRKDRWAFLFRVPASTFPAGARLRFAWHGAAHEAPATPVPEVTVPLAGRAVARSGDRPPTASSVLACVCLVGDGTEALRTGVVVASDRVLVARGERAPVRVLVGAADLPHARPVPVIAVEDTRHPELQLLRLGQRVEVAPAALADAKALATAAEVRLARFGAGRLRTAVVDLVAARADAGVSGFDPDTELVLGLAEPGDPADAAFLVGDGPPVLVGLGCRPAAVPGAGVFVRGDLARAQLEDA